MRKFLSTLVPVILLALGTTSCASLFENAQEQSLVRSAKEGAKNASGKTLLLTEPREENGIVSLSLIDGQGGNYYLKFSPRDDRYEELSNLNREFRSGKLQQVEVAVELVVQPRSEPAYSGSYVTFNIIKTLRTTRE